MRDIKLTLLVCLSLVVLFISCSDKKCNCSVDQKTLIQKQETSNGIIMLNTLDQGSFGAITTLKICDRDNNIIEEIYLRGDEVKPKLDSVVKNNIYISYAYPNSSKEESHFEIPFDNIVVGEGLVNKDNLKFKYIFYGRYIKEQ